MDALDGCPYAPAVDPSTGIADCPACGFHGRAVVHLAYSLARAAGASPARATAFAATQHQTLTRAAATGRSRAEVTSLLRPRARACANRRPATRRN
ncbi:hypothetical protein [Hamadaea tsunoensis]|uniref:hypothetical protein n=1 Tax=Hamadaea tsunoensis TaxID=53368 RepID=UPI0004015E53|nr:hypothetical protein [Hamadaea tsunoensis]